MCWPFHIRSFVSLHIAVQSACSASTGHGGDNFAWNSNTSSVIVTRSIGGIVLDPCDTFRCTRYAERVSMSSLYECFMRVFHAGLRGTVSLSHVVCWAVVELERLKMGCG